MNKHREYDNDILRLWNQNLSIKEIVEQLDISNQIVRSRLLLIHKVSFAEVKERTVPIVETECEQCHKFFKHKNSIKNKFCSKVCQNKHTAEKNRNKKTPEEKLESARKQRIYLAIERRDAAAEHFAWTEREKIRKQIRREG